MTETLNNIGGYEIGITEIYTTKNVYTIFVDEPLDNSEIKDLKYILKQISIWLSKEVDLEIIVGYNEPITLRSYSIVGLN